VKEEPQEVEDTHSNGAGISASQSSSSNCANCNTIGTAAGGNGGVDIKELKLKMAALEVTRTINKIISKLYYKLLGIGPGSRDIFSGFNFSLFKFLEFTGNCQMPLTFK
jgi:hypothetical protein